jgi:hypothetical protein
VIVALRRAKPAYAIAAVAIRKRSLPANGYRNLAAMICRQIIAEQFNFFKVKLLWIINAWFATCG